MIKCDINALTLDYYQIQSVGEIVIDPMITSDGDIFFPNILTYLSKIPINLELVITEKTRLGFPSKQTSMSPSFRDSDAFMKEKEKPAESDLEKAIERWNLHKKTRGEKKDKKCGK